MHNTYTDTSNRELKNAKTRYKPRVYLLPRKLARHLRSQAAKYSPSVQLGHLLGEGLPHIQKISITVGASYFSYPDNHVIK